MVLDVPGAGTELARLANELRAIPLQLDVTSADAGRRVVEFLREKGLTLDVLVLNAGITRDKLFANMTPDRWDPVLAVNITSQIALTEALLEAGDVLGAQPRVVSLASTSGIAGNRGQTNYAATKAAEVQGAARALVGRADARADADGVMLDDLWAGLFAALATIVAAGISHGLM